MDGTGIDVREFLSVVGVIIGVGLVLSLIFLGWVFWRVRRINLPPDADFFEALRMTPLSVVILLDLLDLTLDFFAAPFAWVILGKLGLEPLRAVSVIETMIPGTQVLPTMTIAWFIARVWKNSPRLPRIPY